MWKNTFPYYNSNLKIPSFSCVENLVPSTPVPVLQNNQVEYMEVEEESNSANQSTFAASVAVASTKNTENFLPLKSNDDFTKPVLTQQNLTETDNTDCANINDNKKSQSYQDMKDKIRPLVPKHPLKIETNRSMGSFKLLLLLVLSLFILLLSILLYEDQNHKHSSDFVNAVVELKKHVYGQDRAVQILSEYLLLDVPSMKVIALVGGTGVGKSYTAEIIKKNFPRTYSVRQYFPPIENIRDVLIPPFNPHLIILENLKEQHLVDVVNFLKTRHDTLRDRYVTVLIVFNVERMNDDSSRNIDLNRSLDIIKRFFANENIDTKIVPYDSLNEDALERCIINAARDNRLILSDKQFELVKKYLLANNAGCKGAYSKVQVIDR
ncbi:uncharacterized protein LOC109858171 isoform X2 [Pseudomyrmex gracilis]|nr:uncharacterized protein LOC109858171 isoform X2 [Pseudomyrmex gracilis]